MIKINFFDTKHIFVKNKHNDKTYYFNKLKYTY